MLVSKLQAFEKRMRERVMADEKEEEEVISIG